MEKPYLILQLDEHTTDTGYQTRIEAAALTFINDYQNKPQKENKREMAYFATNFNQIATEKTVLIPYISPIISELQKQVFSSAGYHAMIVPLEKQIINTGYKYASGGECMPNVAIIGSIIETVKKKQLDPSQCIVFIPTLCLACNFNQFPVLMDLAFKKSGLHGLQISNPNAGSKIPELPKNVNRNLLSTNLISSILYKLYFSYRPYETQKGSVENVLQDSIQIIANYLKENGSLFEAANDIKQLFLELDVQKTTRPRIGILGDLYVKYNTVLNQDIYSLIEDLGGEVVIPSFTEIVAHFLDADIRENRVSSMLKMGFVTYEKRFESIFSEVLNDNTEPSMDECVNLLHDYGIEHFIVGETTISLGKMLYYIKNKTVDAVIHVNPVFCCPGVVSASIFRKIQNDFQIPIVDLFYDGTNQPNKNIVPHMYYLMKKSTDG